MRARWQKLAALSLLIPALGACVDDEAGPTVVTGRGALNVGMDLVALGIPTGNVTVDFEVADLDTVNNPVDLFDREIPGGVLWDYTSGSFELGDRGDNWAPRWYKVDEFGDQPDDPRKPLLVRNDLVIDVYEDAMDFLRIRGPQSSLQADCPNGEPCWWIYQDLDVIGPDGGWVAYGLVRYGVQVNGLVDHLEVWVEGEVLEPDSLVPLGGSPGGYPDNRADSWVYSGDGCLDMQAGANPFILGHSQLNDAAFTDEGPTEDSGANYDGESDADFCFMANGVWGDDIEGPNSPVAPNTFTSFDLPSYNYYVVWEYDRATNTVRYDRPLLRAQMGVDLDLNGNPLPHAFAPFPFQLGSEFAYSSGPFETRTEFLEDPRVAPAASVIDMTLLNLAPLAAGSEYQVWLYDEVEGESVRIPATYVRLRPDTVGTDELGEPIVEFVPEGEAQTVQSFEGAVARRHVLTIRSRELRDELGIRLRDFTHVVVTVGTGTDAPPSESPAPIWFRFTDQGGTRDNFFDNEITRVGDARFGFMPSLASRGMGWELFGGANIEFVNTEAFGLRLARIGRPPLGYYYEVWLVNQETGERQNLGPVTTPGPEYASLRDADILPNDGELLTDREILSAWKWQEWDEVPAGFAGYTHVYVTLEPKAGAEDVMSPTIIFAAAVPPDLDKIPVETPRR